MCMSRCTPDSGGPQMVMVLTHRAPVYSSRRQEQAQENRRRIIVAAQAPIVDKGYDRTTTADIAGAGGWS